MSKMSDRSKQLEGFLIEPQESLGLEIKEWLDLKNEGAQKTLSQAIIAMVNHGGGHILIGYKDNKNGTYIPLTDSEYRPQYTSDVINNIVEAFVEPSVHCTVHKVKNSDGKVFPIIEVPGGVIPTRLKKGEKKGLDCTYYIRKTGPKSEHPKNAYEWDSLVKRCWENYGRKHLDIFRKILEETGYTYKPTEKKGKRDYDNGSICL